MIKQVSRFESPAPINLFKHPTVGSEDDKVESRGQNRNMKAKPNKNVNCPTG